MTGQLILPSNVRLLYESRIVSSPLERAERPKAVEANSIRAQAGRDLVHAVRQWLAAAPRLASAD